MYNKEGSSISLEGPELVPLIKQTFESGGEFKLLVTGNSMFPFIKHMRDSVFLTHPSNRALKRGEIVFIERETKKLVLHRVFKMKSNGFIMNGDAQLWDEFVPLEQVIAVVSKIERKSRVISCDNKTYQFLSELWMLLRPIRGLGFKSAGLLIKIWKKGMSVLGFRR
jgi:hypothetical protein